MWKVRVPWYLLPGGESGSPLTRSRNSKPGRRPSQHPFRRPTNSGTLFAGYTTGPFDVALSGYFAGARDDSTFLSDAFFGNSLLLPNKDLEPAYQKIDVSASYRVHPRVRIYTTIDNILNEDYSAAFGFPSLPATIRLGASVGLGGDR